MGAERRTLSPASWNGRRSVHRARGDPRAPVLVRRRVIARLLISCPDRPGIVAAISRFLFERGANIIHSDQHSTDPEGGRFFLRMEFDLDGRRHGARRWSGRSPRRSPSRSTWTGGSRYAAERKRVAILVSRYDHCLLDLLWRWRRGELEPTSALVVSNHADARSATSRRFGVPFHARPGHAARASRRPRRRMLELLARRVRSRRARALHADPLRRLPRRVGAPVINIHHSFLPAFAGADPYRRAHERGVKLIGATAHYVTEELDAGPIIEQDVARVSHRDDARTLARIGRDVERPVLWRAVERTSETACSCTRGKTVVS